MKKKLVLIVSFLLMFNSFLFSSLAQDSQSLVIQDSQTLVKEGNDQEPQFFHFNIDIMDRKKTDEKTWSIDFSNEVEILKNSNEDVDIFYTLRKQSEDKYSLSDVMTAPLHKKIKLEKNVRLNKTLSLQDLSLGQYELELQALSKQTEDETWGGRKQLLFTITESGVQMGWDNMYIPSFAPSQSINPDTNIAPYISHDSEEYRYEAPLSKASNKDVTILSSTTITGNWKSYYKNATKNIRNAKVEIRYRDQFYIWRTFGSAYTNTSGNWSISSTTPTANYWEVIIYTQSSFTNTKNPNSSNSTWSSNIFYTSLINGSNINLTLTNGTDVNKAFTVYEDIATINSFLVLSGKDPGSANNVFFNSIIDQTSQAGSGNVWLYKNTPGTSTPMHELSHHYMYNLYGSIPPTTSCSNHTFQSSTSQGCAWVEGWASIVPLIFGNGVYTYTNGSVINLENTSTFSTGDTVEGRVLGSLWDLYDSSNDGVDTYSYSFSSIYRAMWDGGTKNTFSDWWTKWKALGYNTTNAKSCLSQNSIIYN